MTLGLKKKHYSNCSRHSRVSYMALHVGFQRFTISVANGATADMADPAAGSIRSRMKALLIYLLATKLNKASGKYKHMKKYVQYWPDEAIE